jgi:hypothetical protein
MVEVLSFETLMYNQNLAGYPVGFLLDVVDGHKIFCETPVKFYTASHHKNRNFKLLQNWLPISYGTNFLNFSNLFYKRM